MTHPDGLGYNCILNFVADRIFPPQPPQEFKMADAGRGRGGFGRGRGDRGRGRRGPRRGGRKDEEKEWCVP